MKQIERKRVHGACEDISHYGRRKQNPPFTHEGWPNAPHQFDEHEHPKQRQQEPQLRGVIAENERLYSRDRTIKETVDRTRPHDAHKEVRHEQASGFLLENYARIVIFVRLHLEVRPNVAGDKKKQRHMYGGESLNKYAQRGARRRRIAEPGPTVDGACMIQDNDEHRQCLHGPCEFQLPLLGHRKLTHARVSFSPSS